MNAGAGRLYRFSDYDAPIRIETDYVVVGSGPGGAMAAYWLSRTGARVVLVEAGPALGPTDFHRDIGKTLASYFWEGGTRAARGNVVFPTLQARALGGGTVFNSAICMRPLPTSLERWRDDHGLVDYTPEALAPHFDAVEAFLGIKPTREEVQGRRNELFRDACDALGWSWASIERFEDGCIGSGECISGCRHEKKNSLDRRGVPELVAAGGKVYTSVQIDGLITHAGKIQGVTGATVNPATWERRHPVRIAAARTIVAAGAIGTPSLLRRAGLTRAVIGSDLIFHPSCYILGAMDEVVNPWNGATQGIHSAHHLERGIKLESLWSTTAVFSRGLPRQPKMFKRWLKRWPNLCSWDGWISGDASRGRVRNLPGTDKIDITFDLGEADLRRLQEANALLCEMFAAVGAKEVVHGVAGLPEVLPPAEAAEQIRHGKFSVLDLPTASNHVMGGCPMGADADRAVCDGEGKVYDVDGLWLCDTGIYPSSPGVNPQLTAMALAHRLAGRLAARA